MQQEQTTRSRPEFSPTKALALSLPLFITMGAIVGPLGWDIAANAIGWTGPNIARSVRSWFLNDSVLVLPTFIAALICCPKVVRHCDSTRGHDKLRKVLLLVHVLAYFAFYLTVAIVVLMIVFNLFWG